MKKPTRNQISEVNVTIKMPVVDFLNDDCVELIFEWTDGSVTTMIFGHQFSPDVEHFKNIDSYIDEYFPTDKWDYTKLLDKIEEYKDGKYKIAAQELYEQFPGVWKNIYLQQL